MLFHPRHSKYCRFNMQPKVKGPAEMFCISLSTASSQWIFMWAGQLPAGGQGLGCPFTFRCCHAHHGASESAPKLNLVYMPGREASVSPTPWGSPGARVGSRVGDRTPEGLPCPPHSALMCAL